MNGAERETWRGSPAIWAGNGSLFCPVRSAADERSLEMRPFEFYGLTSTEDLPGLATADEGSIKILFRYISFQLWALTFG
jgi:hypothetical protein